ncbi:MAG: MurR/RpiR family transcriptional regulator [Planctomycetota bacterium]
MFLSDLIATAGDRLTPTERVLAEAVLGDPTLIVFGTVSDLAGRVGTSRPSVVRFANKLGFDGYSDLQRCVRQDLSNQLGRPSQRIRQLDESMAPVRGAVERAMAKVFASLDEGRLAKLAEPIVHAENVWVMTGETSQAGARAFYSGMTMVRPGVRLIVEHSSARDLAGAAQCDVAVVFDFARYRRHSVAASRMLAERGIDIVAITDGPLSPLAALTEHWCGLDVPGIGPFDSSVPAVMVAELLVAQVAGQLRDQARERIDRTEALWESVGTFHQE